MRRLLLALVLGLVGALAVGCSKRPVLAAAGEGLFVDRRDVEYPSDLRLEVALDRLDTPTAATFAGEGRVIIAEGGENGSEPRITLYEVGVDLPTRLYPPYRGIFTGRLGGPRPIRGPVGGLAVVGDEVFVTHEDDRGMGVVSALPITAEKPRNGRPRTVVADLPARGDHGVNAISAHPTTGRLYFGVGSATNSGVVGLDNFDKHGPGGGWARRHDDFHDVPAADLHLLGYRFDTPNPRANFFGGRDLAVTGPMAAFGESVQHVPASPTGKPTAAVYSVSPGGGDLRVEAHGLRQPVGLVFNGFGSLYVSNRGMQLRGTRPVRDDPDAVVRVPLIDASSVGGGTWFGWPDYSADLTPVTDERLAPPTAMIARSGYPSLSTLIDAERSGLLPPDRQTLLRGVFPAAADVAGLAFPPESAAFRPWRDELLVALAGSHRVVRLDPQRKVTADYIYNTRGAPAAALDKPGLSMQRPVQVLAGADGGGAVYVLDEGTGRLYRLMATPPSVELEDVGDDPDAAG